MLNPNGSPMTFGWDHGAAAADQNHWNLFRTLFSSEILAAYEENLLLRPLIKHHTITQGVREQFRRTWKMTAERQARGQEMIPQDMEATQVTIELDERPMYASAFFEDIDLMLTHFDKRSEAVKQLALSLARADDSQIARLIVKASQYTKAAGDNSSFPDGGGAIHDTALDIDIDSSASDNNDAAGAVLKAIGRAFRQFDLNDVPMEGLHCGVKRELWHAMLEAGVPFDNTGLTSGQRPLFADQFVAAPKFGDLNQMPTRQTPLMYRGVKIWNIPSFDGADYSAVDEPKYQVDLTNTAGAIWSQEAVARLNLMGLTLGHERQESRGGDWVGVRELAGGGTLRGEGAIELRLDAEPE